MQRPFVLLLLALSACSPGPRPTAAVVNVHVLPMTGDTVLRDHTVLLAGDRILRVGPAESLRVPLGVEVVEGEGRYLLPGLWDMHVHFLADAEAFGPLFLAHGVTGVRDMGSLLADLERVRPRAGEDLPRLVAAGPLLDGPQTAWSHDVAWHVVTAEEAEAAVDSLAAAGVDFVKAYSTLPADAYHALVRSAAERGLPVAGHVPFAVGAAGASDAGQASLEHAGPDMTVNDCVDDGGARFRSLLGVWAAEGYGAYLRGIQDLRRERREDCRRALFERFARNETWVVPTIVNTVKDRGTVDWEALEAMDADRREACRGTVEGFEQAPEELRAAYHRAFLEDVGALHRAGVPLLAGTDVPNPCLAPGASLHLELERLVQAGLTPFEALETATVGSARFLGLEGTVGTVEEGGMADLVIVDANPLEDIRNSRRIHAVLLGGRVVAGPGAPR